MTIPFINGLRYQFQFKPKGRYNSPAAVATQNRTLTFLRDAKEDGKVIHHIFQTKGGALECFTDWQINDYIITKK